jgi:hypothetical protein
MKNFMTLGALTKGKEPEGDLGGKGATPFPGEEAIMMIYGECWGGGWRCATNLSAGSLARCC